VGKDQIKSIVNGNSIAVEYVLQQLYTYDQTILAFPTVAGPEVIFKGRNKSVGVHKTDTKNMATLDLANVRGRNKPDALTMVQNAQKITKNATALMSDPATQGQFARARRSQEGKHYSYGLQDKRFRSIDPADMIERSEQNYRGDNSGGGDSADFFTGLDPDSIKKRRQYGINRPSATHVYLEKQLDTVLATGQVETLLAQDLDEHAKEGYVLGLNEFSTFPDFIIETLSMALEMHQSQAAALLSTNQKFLIHLCVKGMKGKDYSKLKVWFSVLSSRVDTFIKLMEQEADNTSAIRMALNVVKTGFLSHDAEVVDACFRFFSKLYATIQQGEAQGVKYSSRLKAELYDWFCKTTMLSHQDYPVFKNQVVDIYNTWLKIPKKPSDLEKLTNEAGICAFIRAYHYHGDAFIEQFAQGLIQYGETDYVEVIFEHLLIHCQNNKDFLLIMHDLFDLLYSTQKGRVILIESGNLQTIIELNLKIIQEFDDQSLLEKQVALSFLVHIWREKPEMIETSKEVYTDQIIQCLKLGCRDIKSSAMRTTSINLAFVLLFDFTKNKNKFAPVIYKALTFLLIDGYNNHEIREEMLKNFITLFTQHTSIPINILCEPLLKLVRLNLEKEQMHET
jgi:hypothetical protein